MDSWRYARHFTLEGVGERGQARLAAASAVVSDDDPAALALARRYLAAGGVGQVTALAGASSDPGWLPGAVVDEASRSVVRGSLLALAAMRAALAGGSEPA